MQKQHLHNTIMRRIYYAYAIRMLRNPLFLHGAAMIALVVSLTYFVSLPDVLRNVSNVPVGELGRFAVEAVTYTEAWTLLILGAFIFMLFSLRIQLRSSYGRETQTV